MCFNGWGRFDPGEITVEEDLTQVRSQCHMSHTPTMAARYYKAVFVARWKSRSITIDIPIWQKAIWLVTKIYLPRLEALVNLCGLVLFASCTWTITSLVWRESHAATTASTLNTLFPYLVTSVRETCYNIKYTEDLKFKLKMVAVMGGAK